MNKNNILHPIFAFAMLALSCSPALAETVDTSAGDKAAIHLDVTNIQPQKGGSLVVLLYNRTSWLEPKQAIRHIEIPVKGKGKFSLDLTGLPYPAIYAVQLFQDENGNHEMDMHWFPYPHPSEPYGFSNNYKPFAKPSFTKASFPLNKKKLSLKIKMRD